MTHHIRTHRTIPVAAQALWETIRQMSGMEDWYPDLIRESDITDPNSMQPRRTCILRDGGVLKERILLRDDATRTFVYAIDSHPMPAQKVVGTIRVDELETGHSHVTWSADMVLDPASADSFGEMVQSMYGQGLAALEHHHTR